MISEVKKESNGVAFKAKCKDEENISEDKMACFARKLYKKFHKQKSFGAAKKADARWNYVDNLKNDEIQCKECKGFGHIQRECDNTLKKVGANVASLSDSSDTDSDGNYAGFVSVMAKSELFEVIPKETSHPSACMRNHSGAEKKFSCHPKMCQCCNRTSHYETVNYKTLFTKRIDKDSSLHLNYHVSKWT